MFGFHDHIDHGQRRVGVPQQRSASTAGIGMEKLQGAAIEFEIGQRQLGDFVDARLVVHNQDFPRQNMAV